ncbi:hypothetical protein C8Q75DRAFT_773423 [Abortiporus biennis]|nr:hypothetical protein C8Q75DRAFT_773423 [Abortiporus biennis]
MSSTLSPSLPTASTLIAMQLPSTDLPETRVRFEDECVLIPDPAPPSRMPRLIKKSYSLPLWKKRSPSVDDSDKDTPSSPVEENLISFTVPVPSFSRSLSPGRSEHVHQPLVSCIVDHAHPHNRRARRPSLPLPIRPDLVTVPLRPCCSKCFPITEECLKGGSEWKEKFSRGARRRRSASTSNEPSHFHHKDHRLVADDIPGFEAVLNVDEVDILHKKHHSDSSPVHTSASSSGEAGLLPSLTRQTAISSTSIEIDTPTPDLPSSIGVPPAIREEDEDSLILISASPVTSPICSSSDSSSSSSSVDSVSNVTTLPPAISNLVDNTFICPNHTPPLVASPIAFTSTASSSSDLIPTPPSHSAPIPISIPVAHSKPSPPMSSHSYGSSNGISPSSEFSPQHARTISTPGSPGSSWRRPHIHLPNAGSFIRAGVEVLKGVNSLGGSSPLAV